MIEEIVAAIWRRRVAWSRAADKLKSGITRARVAALAMSASGALLATLAATVLADVAQWRTVCAAAGAVFVAGATFVTTRFITTDAVRAWTRARSVSEAIKAEVYAFRAGADPYAAPDAIAVLQKRVREVEEAAKDLERHVAAVTADVAVPRGALSPADYAKNRVSQQIERYYRPKARLYARRLVAFRRTELALGLIATVLGALAAFISGTTAGENSVVGAWVAVFTTLGAALAAHVAANRYDFLVMSYSATARRLEDLVSDWRVQGSSTDLATWSEFVKACEDAISVENESWLAKFAAQDASG